MTCEEVREQLHPYFDGELPEEQVRAVETALEECPDCQADLEELVAMRAMMHQTLVEPVELADFSGFADQVMTRVEAEEGEKRTNVIVGQTPAPGLLEQLVTWFTPPRLAGACAVALAALVFWPGSPESMDKSTSEESVATVSETRSKRGRRPMETESVPTGRNAATVESWEVAQGRVEIDQNTDDPSTPLVVWHIIDEEGAPSGDTGL